MGDEPAKNAALASLGERLLGFCPHPPLAETSGAGEPRPAVTGYRDEHPEFADVARSHGARRADLTTQRERFQASALMSAFDPFRTFGPQRLAQRKRIVG